MKSTFAMTKNVRRFMAGMEILRTPIKGKYGLMLAYGPPGCGKTEIGDWYNSQHSFPYVRALKTSTHRSILSDLVGSLKEVPTFRTNTLFEQVLNILDEFSPPIIIDEVDYLVKSDVIETIRDISDMTNVPIVLMGMENLDGRLRSYRHLYDRIRAVVKLELFDEEEIRNLAEQICEVNIDDSGIRFIKHHGQGKLRLTVSWFGQAESIVKHNKGIETVGAEHLQVYLKKEKKK